jgi:hydrophobe/amphiphile efflux-3 (HAE3) family protein
LAALALTGLSIVGLIGIDAGPLHLSGLKSDARIELLADPNTDAYRRQARFADTFGSDPIVIMLQPKPGSALITPNHIVGLSHLEGKLHDSPGVKKVYGPGTLVNTLAISTTKVALDACARQGKAAEEAARQNAAAAGKSQADQEKAAQDAFTAGVRTCAERYAKAFPSLGLLAVNDPVFLQGVLLEPDGQHVRSFWNWALPDLNHAVITVRLNRDASLDQIRTLVKTALDAPTSKDLRELSDLRVTTSGSPALASALAESIFDSLKWLLPIALIAMLLMALLALLRVTVLLAAPLSALATLWTGGIAGLAHLPVTPATLAVLPVVLGLATDYFIQSANRFDEEPGSIRERIAATAHRILPSTGLAALATAGGMLAFAASPIPMVRQFGLFMALGVAMAYLANYLVGLPALQLMARVRPRVATPRQNRRMVSERLYRLGRLPMAAAMVVIAVGLLGWAALPWLTVETNPAQMLPAGHPALAQAETIRREVGITGEIDLILAADPGKDTTGSAPVQWLSDQTRAIVGRASGDLVALTSLPTFLAGFNRGTLPDEARTKLILDSIPTYFSGAVVSQQHDLALSIFGLRQVTSAEADRRLVQGMESLPAPPDGFHYFAGGLAVVAEQALTQLQADQVKLTLLALAVILLVLTAAYRRLIPALLAVLPTVVAAGVATALLFLKQTPSSPITILLGGVVVAFATEFSVLWLSRYRSELGGGASMEEASAIASRRVGPAIVASSLALIIGFAVLALSPVPTVRDFGIWSAADLALATLSVLTLLPPLARRFLWVSRPAARELVPV